MCVCVSVRLAACKHFHSKVQQRTWHWTKCTKAFPHEVRFSCLVVFRVSPPAPLNMQLQQLMQDPVVDLHVRSPQGLLGPMVCLGSVESRDVARCLAAFVSRELDNLVCANREQQAELRRIQRCVYGWRCEGGRLRLRLQLLPMDERSRRVWERPVCQTAFEELPGGGARWGTARGRKLIR